MIEYIIGGAAGLAYGFVFGFAKYLALWRKIVTTDREITMGQLYMRFGIGYGVNVLALLIIFLTRNLLPVDFAATLLGAAIGLSIAGKLSPVRNITTHIKEDAS